MILLITSVSSFLNVNPKYIFGKHKSWNFLNFSNVAPVWIFGTRKINLILRFRTNVFRFCNGNLVYVTLSISNVKDSENNLKFVFYFFNWSESPKIEFLEISKIDLFNFSIWMHLYVLLEQVQRFYVSNYQTTIALIDGYL